MFFFLVSSSMLYATFWSFMDDVSEVGVVDVSHIDVGRYLLMTKCLSVHLSAVDRSIY